MESGQNTPPRRESSLLRHECDSPVISLKRLMQQLREELEGLRQQQDGLLKQLNDQRSQDEAHKIWVKERLDTLDRTVQEASATASAVLASVSAAAASANAAASAATAAASAPSQPTSRVPVPNAAAPPQLFKTASFEFARHLIPAAGRDGSGSGPSLRPLGANPFGNKAGDGAGPPPPAVGPGVGPGPAPPWPVGGSPRRRFRHPSPFTSDEERADDEADEELYAALVGTGRRAAGPEDGSGVGRSGQDSRPARPRLRRSGTADIQHPLPLLPQHQLQQNLRPPAAAGETPEEAPPSSSAFAVPSAQMTTMRTLASIRSVKGSGGDSDGLAEGDRSPWTAAVSAAGRGSGSGSGPGLEHDEATLRLHGMEPSVRPRLPPRRPPLPSQRRQPPSVTEGEDEAEELKRSLLDMQNGLPSAFADSGLASLDSGTGEGGGGGPDPGGGRDLRHWNSQGHSSFGHASSLSQTLGLGGGYSSGANRATHAHGSHHHHHSRHLQHSFSQGHGQGGHPFFHHNRSSSHGANGPFGSVAQLFPSLSSRHATALDELQSPVARPPPPPPASIAPSSPTAPGGMPREPYSSTVPPLDLSRLTWSRGGPGTGGEGGAPSLARDSVRSASLTEHNTDRVETASVKHFKGIPPRLVEIYRQRAETSHWSLGHEPGLMSRVASRRGSTDAMLRPVGLVRQSVMSQAAAEAVGGGAGGGPPLGRLSRGPGGGGSGKGWGHGEGAGKDGGYEEVSAFALYDPNYDHPRMIGDDDEYDRPLTIVERLKLYVAGLIRPEGRTKWDLFILLLLVWVLFASPFIICFGLSGDVMEGDWLGIVELCVDGAFLFDIFLNFRTAYYDSKGHLVTQRWRIARHYIKTWFLLDVICVIPYDLITAGTMGFLSMLKLLRVIRVGKVIRMIKMYRLLRVIRLPRILERMEMFIDRGALQVMAFILSVGLLAHLSACVFFYMAYLDGLGPQTWVAAYGVQDADLATQYLTALYWAFTTTATVGYGDITPKTDKEKILAIFVMCMGVSLVGYVTSSITNIMAIKNAQQTNIANKKQLVTDVLKARSVPSELSRRVYNYFNYVSSKMIRREEAGLLDELPFKLRSRMLYAFYADMLSRIPAISRLPPHVLIELVSQLKSHYFVEGDIVAMQGDYIDALYIVSEGLLEVRTYMFPADVETWRIFEAVHKDELRHMPYSAEGRLKPRCMYGQAGVLYGGVWPATVIARNCCELYGLDREGLEHMLSVQSELQEMLGLPKAPVPACVAHAASLSGPDANALLPPTDRSVLYADFPIMDAAPQRGLMQSMLRSMGNMITGGLARASAAHYPHVPGSGLSFPSNWPCGSPGTPPAGGGGGGKDKAASGAERARAVWRSGLKLMGLGRSSMGGATGSFRGGEGGGGAGEGAANVNGGGGEGLPETTYSRFRPFGSGSGGRSHLGRNAAAVQMLETSRLLNGADRSDSNGAMAAGSPGPAGAGGGGGGGSLKV